jgi:hypothetical protein
MFWRNMTLLATCWFLAGLIRWPWRWRRHVPLKRRLTFSGLHSIISQKVELFKQKMIHLEIICLQILFQRRFLKSIIFWDVTPCSLLFCLPPAYLLVFAEIISSTPKMEAICSSITLVATQQTTRRHIPEDDTLNKHRCENLKSYIVSFLLITVLSLREASSLGRSE